MKSFLGAHKIGFSAGLLLAFYVGVSLATTFGWIGADFDVVQNHLSYQPPNREAWLGTDLFGRSVLSRALQATKTALMVGIVATSLSVAIAILLGGIAGFRGGWLDALVVWVYTTLDSIPYILLLAAFAFALGQGLLNLLLALGLTTWTTLCKMVRSEVMKLKRMDFVMAAQAQGLPAWKILLREILPNLSHIVVIQAGVIFVSVIKIEVIMSYLGLGLEPGSPSWGLMIDDGKQEISRGIWWNMLTATTLMFGLILATQMMLEELRRRWDRKS